MDLEQTPTAAENVCAMIRSDSNDLSRIHELHREAQNPCAISFLGFLEHEGEVSAGALG